MPHNEPYLHLKYHPKYFSLQCHISSHCIGSLSGDQLFSRCFYLTKSLILSNPREETPTQSFPLKGRIFATEMIDLRLITKADLASSCKLLKSKQQAPCGFCYPANIKVASALFLQNGMTSLEVEVTGSVLLPQNGTTCRSTTHWLHSTSQMSLSVSPTSQLELKPFLTKVRRIQRARQLPLIFSRQRARNGEPPVAAKCLQWPL